MRQTTPLLLALIGALPFTAPGQSSDPSDYLLTAWTSNNRGDKAAAAGNPRAALAAYKQALAALDELTDRFPTWQTMVVKYRREKTAERVAEITPLAAKAPAVAAVEEDPAGPLPGGGDSLFPGDDALAEAPAVRAPSVSLGGDPIQEIQMRFEALQNDLKNTRERLAVVTQERADLATKYDEAIKEAETAVKKQQMITQRADLAEEALLSLESEGARNSEEAKKMRAELEAARKALVDAKYDREAAEELRQQTADRLRNASQRVTALSQERDAATKESAEVPAKLAAMQKEVAKALDEKNALGTKLEKVEQQLAIVTTERDEARAQVARLKNAQEQIDKLLADNTALMAKLSDAESTIANFKLEGAKKDEEIARLNKEMSSVKAQLSQTQKESAAYQAQMSDLQAQLDAQAKDLQQVKSTAATSAAERKKLQEENGILRGVVLRQMKEQARRDGTKKMVLAEMAKLEIQSKALITQIEYLGQPVVKLTAKERRLFKEPIIEISDAEISIAAPKEDSVAATDGSSDVAVNAATEAAAEQPPESKTPEEPAPPAEGAPEIVEAPETTAPAASELSATNQPATEQPAAEPPVELAKAELPRPLLPPVDASASDLPAKDPEQALATALSEAAESVNSGAPAAAASVSPNVPEELLPLAHEGKEQFERGNYREAEKTYEKILAKAPNNLYALSNLGVVRFRGGKLKLAEEAFKKAIAVAPEDAFSHCTLGIVYYSQGKYDEAVNSLTKALAINPKNATAHNYLGITASQKGWQEAAQQELETATALDPNYADAFFNLAVVYATQQPPNKEDARRSYKRATELGADPDSSLEQLIK